MLCHPMFALRLLSESFNLDTDETDTTFVFCCAERGGQLCFGCHSGSAASVGTSIAFQLPTHDIQNCIFYLELELHLECFLNNG